MICRVKNCYGSKKFDLKKLYPGARVKKSYLKDRVNLILLKR
jgi:hypothetical protein